MMKVLSLFLCAVASLQGASSFVPSSHHVRCLHGGGTVVSELMMSNAASTEEWKARSVNQRSPVPSPVVTPAGGLAVQQKNPQSPKSERTVLGLPADEWWDRPLDRERDPPHPFQEWGQFWKDGTLPKRVRGGSFVYDEYYSDL
ncbi:expressed unknown protein [Seminavis robusta]|uniref:Uncharacterized protein n=1 Tax=Seminavis robusta TaxID=568900 RepID=A0A9N8H0C0_9STRA|nr:expressed unknown protein [Seminavis robusta]|eukprot:Sro18_g012840.1 n/a (144) ;mRNA; r:76041-76472